MSPQGRIVGAGRRRRRRRADVRLANAERAEAGVVRPPGLRRADGATPTTSATTARLAWWSPRQQLVAGAELNCRRNPYSRTLRPEHRRTYGPGHSRSRLP